MTAVGSGSPAGPRRRTRGPLLVLVAVVVSSVAASATALALGSRADLSSSRKRVDAAWAALRPALDGRYRDLGDAAAGRAAYNTAVAAYQRARGGFPRRLVAGALGYDDRRTLEVPT